MTRDMEARNIGDLAQNTENLKFKYIKIETQIIHNINQ
jgi:hypothetical protein